MTCFARYRTPAIGFETIAGRNDGLRRIVLAAGQVGVSEGGPLHLHHGEEILHILSGEVEVTVGSEIRRCLGGDVVIIPTDTPHQFTTITEAEVLGEDLLSLALHGSWALGDFAQAYAVLTLCRAAEALATGRQVSKLAAANAGRSRYPEWSTLIDWAQDWWYHSGSDLERVGKGITQERSGTVGVPVLVPGGGS
jgi:hypothetical protein